MSVRILLLLAGALLGASIASRVDAQTDPSSAVDPPTLEQLAMERAQVETRTDLEPEVRDAFLAAIDSAQEHLRAAQAFRTETDAHQREAADAPRRLAALREELATPATPADDPSTAVPLVQLRADLDRLRAEFAAAEVEEQSLLAESETRDTRRSEISTRLGAISRELSLITQELTGLDGSDRSDLTSRGTLLELTSRQVRLDAESANLEAERRSLDARRELLPLRQELATRQTRFLEAEVARLAETVARREREAATDAEARALARQQAIESNPVLSVVAATNAELSSVRPGLDGLIEKKESAQDSAERIEGQLTRVRTAFRSVLDQVRWIGLSDRTGRLLREQLSALPIRGSIARELRQVRRSLGETQFELRARLEAARSARDIEGRVSAIREQLLATLPADAEPEDGEAILEEARVLYREQRGYLDDIVGDLGEVAQLDQRRIELLTSYQQVTEIFRTYLEARVLWVPSILTPPAEQPQAAADSIAWLFDLSSWRAGGNRLRRDAAERWPSLVFAGLLLALLLGIRPAIGRASARAAERVRHHSTDRWLDTWAETAYTIALAAPIPLFLGWFGAFLRHAPDQTEVVIAVGDTLIALALPIFAVLFFEQATRPKGLGECHLRWPTTAVQALRKEIRRWVPLFLLAIGVTILFESQSERRFAETTGRAALFVGVIFWSIFSARILRPRGPVLKTFLDRNPTSLLRRLRWLWAPVLIFGPLALGLAALVGYSYTAMELGTRGLVMIGFLLLVVLAHAFLLRWLFAARRRLAVDLARQRAEARKEEARESAVEGGEGGDAAEDEDAIDIPALDVQTKQMFRAGLAITLGVGLFLIWADKLPALQVFDRIEIYPQMRWVSTEAAEEGAIRRYESVIADAATTLRAPSEESTTPKPQNTEPETAAAPSESAESSTLPGPLPNPLSSESGSGEPAPPAVVEVVTLADVGLMIIVLCFMVIAARNLPALLEFAILQRLPLDRGAKYAIRTILRYLILIIGTTIAFSAIGIGWSRLQWLAAAATFGLAFGLQEIFANFVSGLIILIERPVRVGDVVTVAGVEGRVTRLQMRSTTIQDWERREFLVPNKEFITGNLLNWTLSDPVSRLVVVVGVAYGSDVRKAESELLRIAGENSHVLSDPAPNVVFRSFGASSLDFELRVFIQHRELWAVVTNQIHFAIDEAFRKEGIEISFPQRDLHIRSLPEGVEIKDSRGEE